MSKTCDSSRPVILMTDFGESEYVGMMRGVIRSLCPSAEILDLTHSITPQSVTEGAWVLLKSYRFFPVGSLFVAVVDPGVGSARDAVIVRTREYTFLGPDNGLLYPTATENGLEAVYSIIVPTSVSKTFHGRDVFAVAAGRLSAGAPIDTLGVRKGSLDVPLIFHLEGPEGQVVRIDRFGNVITNIPPTDRSEVELVIHGQSRRLRVVDNYAAGSDSELLVVIGSAGTLEIAVKNGRAAELLQVQAGDIVMIRPL
ncbi:MAG: SAM-dependent chlorinase/fluorinase [Candidatus Thorarchaeota archaeon]